MVDIGTVEYHIVYAVDFTLHPWLKTLWPLEPLYQYIILYPDMYHCEKLPHRPVKPPPKINYLILGTSPYTEQ